MTKTQLKSYITTGGVAMIAYSLGRKMERRRIAKDVQLFRKNRDYRQ